MQALTQPALLESDGVAAPRLEGADWWRGAMGYEVYVRSFQDSNGDGVGDLAGVSLRLPYLASLGVDVVWLTPFFASPGLDHGYDVADYLAIDPLLGTLDDWDHLATTAKALGLRLFVDVVPNHTSDLHRWFQQATADPTGPYRDYYVWSDPATDGGPPNNWVSHFGGPAWSLDPGGSGQYYCHLFLPEQPDLNWANPAVMHEFTEILRFWSDRGADGFRIDVAHGLTKDPALRDNPALRAPTADMHPMEVFASFQHIHDLHRHETVLLFQSWRAAVADRDVVLVGEMDTRDVDRFAEYVNDQTALHAGFVLQIGLTEWDPADIIATMLEYQQKSAGGVAWEVSNHDQARGVSRYGGGEVGLRRTLALTTMMAGFDGMVFLYQGEELGLPDALVLGGVEDPMASRNSEGTWGRDVARGPMPWTSGPANGFTDASSAWLHTEPLPVELTADHQLGDAGSNWHRYRRLTLLRKRYPALWRAPFDLADRGDRHVIIARDDLRVVANLGTEALAVPSAYLAQVLFSSCDEALRVDGDTTWVSPETAVVARARAS